MAKRGRTLAAGPTAPTGTPAGGPPPPWWPDWMPWIDLDAWRQIFKSYGEFVNPPGGAPPPTGREAIQNMSDFLEDMYRKMRKAVDEKMKER